mmetsp:Transcript_40125/g.64478  ORF Transcript_40125/g.64478 Transcript_40125/m.64478 type:complete len:211 (-) Transcript_40125:338-970(-)
MVHPFDGCKKIGRNSTRHHFNSAICSQGHSLFLVGSAAAAASFRPPPLLIALFLLAARCCGCCCFAALQLFNLRFIALEFGGEASLLLLKLHALLSQLRLCEEEGRAAAPPTSACSKNAALAAGTHGRGRRLSPSFFLQLLLCPFQFLRDSLELSLELSDDLHESPHSFVVKIDLAYIVFVFFAGERLLLPLSSFLLRVLSPLFLAGLHA